MQDRADPHFRERALAVASQDPPSGVTPDEAVAGNAGRARFDRRHPARSVGGLIVNRKALGGCLTACGGSESIVRNLSVFLKLLL